MDSQTPIIPEPLTEAWRRTIAHTVKSAGVPMADLMEVERHFDGEGTPHLTLKAEKKPAVTIIFDVQLEREKVFEYLTQIAKANLTKGWDVT